MKNIYLKILTALAVLMMSNSMYAYRWRMRNDTSKTLLVQLELAGNTSPFFYIVIPKTQGVDQYADFDWPVGNTRWGFCFGRIKYVVVDSELATLLKNKNLIQYVDESVSGKTINKPVIVDNGQTLSWIEGEEKNPKSKYRRITSDFLQDTANETAASLNSASAGVGDAFLNAFNGGSGATKRKAGGSISDTLAQGASWLLNKMGEPLMNFLKSKGCADLENMRIVEEGGQIKFKGQ